MQKQGLSCHAAYSSEECTQTTETNPPASSLDSRFSNRQMVSRNNPAKRVLPHCLMLSGAEDCRMTIPTEARDILFHAAQSG